MRLNGSLRRARSVGIGPAPFRPVEARLGKLLKLPIRRPSPGEATPRGSSGQIVLFTGVRYERTDPPAAGPQGSADRPKRSRG
jgi:hypothetical protein